MAIYLAYAEQHTAPGKSTAEALGYDTAAALQGLSGDGICLVTQLSASAQTNELEVRI